MLHQHSATIDRSGLQVREHLVDVVQVRFVNLRPDLALGGECDGFREVLSAAYDRAADRDAFHHDVENRRPEFS
jgi:hypothetical protein